MLSRHQSDFKYSSRIIKMLSRLCVQALITLLHLLSISFFYYFQRIPETPIDSFNISTDHQSGGQVTVHVFLNFLKFCFVFHLFQVEWKTGSSKTVRLILELVADYDQRPHDYKKCAVWMKVAAAQMSPSSRSKMDHLEKLKIIISDIIQPIFIKYSQKWSQLLLI